MNIGRGSTPFDSHDGARERPEVSGVEELFTQLDIFSVQKILIACVRGLLSTRASQMARSGAAFKGSRAWAGSLRAEECRKCR